jgi:YgiT-type zinc finger domain-containing protein
VPAAGSSSLLSTSLERHCADCGGDSIQLKHVTRSFGKGANLLVIEGVPMWSCPKCGASYFTAKTMHEIERIKALRKSLAVKRSVAVVAYEAADASTAGLSVPA